MLEFHPFLREGWLTPVLAEMAAAFTRPHCCFFSFPLCSLWISGTWVGNWSDRGTRSEVAAVLGFHLLEFHHPLPRPPLYCLQQMETPAGMWWLSFSAPGCSGQGWNLWLNQVLAVRTLFSVRPVAWMWTCPGAWTTSAMVEVCGISTLLSRISSWTGKFATSRPFSPTEQFAFLGWFLLVLRTHLPGCPSSWWNHSLILHNVLFPKSSLLCPSCLYNWAMPPGSHPGYSLLQNAHGARFEVGSAEGVIGWLPGDGDAGGQKLWLLPGGCKDSGLLPIADGCLGLCRCSAPATKIWVWVLQYLVLYLWLLICRPEKRRT